MSKRWRKTVGIFLALCLMLSVIPIDGLLAGSVMAAENGTLQNGEFSKGTDGWTISGNCPKVEAASGNDYLDVYGGDDSTDSETSTLEVSQTVSNMKAGLYVAKAAIVGEGNNLTLTVKNETKGSQESVELTATGWNDNWKTEEKMNFSTKSIEVAEGDKVTVVISGTINKGNWYNITNVKLETSENDSTGAVPATITIKKIDGLSEDFIHGVDLSMYLSEAQSGVAFQDMEGDEKGLFDLLKGAGVNYVRLRLWNCPYAVDYNGCWRYVDNAEPGQETEYYTADQGKNEDGTNKVASNVKKYTTGEGQTYKYKDKNGEEKIAGTLTIKQPLSFADKGEGSGKEWAEYFIGDTQVYPEGFGAGNCGIDTVKTIGKIATDHGMKVLIDFHYSDFWADPNKWSVPRVWGKDMPLDDKADALYEYTKSELNTLLDAGVDVGMVQIGNEINNGLAGEKENPHALLRAGSKAVREVSQDRNKDILIAVHYTDPHDSDFQMEKAQALKDQNVDYDVFATSYYPFWHRKPQELTAKLKKLADTYDKKVMVAEISYPWTNEDGDGYPDMVTSGKADQTFDYPISVEGQATVIRDTIAAVAGVGDNGIGTFYWEPAWIPANVCREGMDGYEEAFKKNMSAWRKYGSGWASIYAAEVDPEVVDDENGGTWDNQAYFDFNGKMLDSLNVYKYVYTGSIAPTSVGMIDTAVYTMDYKKTPNLPKEVTAHLSDGKTISVPVTWNQQEVETLKSAAFGEYRISGKTGAFSYEDTNTGTGDVKKEEGAYDVTCVVQVAGVDYVSNGSFENNRGENGEDAIGWTSKKNNDATSAHVGMTNSANAKSGTAYYDLWAAANSAGVDFELEQEISKNLPAGLYTLQAWFMGVRIDSTEGSMLYAVVTDKNGKEKRYESDDVKINNTWKDFYQGTLADIVVDENTQSVKVGTRVVCKSSKGEGAWVTVDDISLMWQGNSAQPKKCQVTYDVNGGQKLAADTKTYNVGSKYGSLPSPKRAGYLFKGWYTAKVDGTKITADSRVNGDTTIYAQWKKVAKPGKTKKPAVKNSAKKTITVSFKKVKGADGYQISYSTSRNFKKGTVKTVTSTKLSKIIKKLKKGNTYYVRVCAYKTDSAGKKVFGANSPAASVKIKK
ncbi:hypothetical protein D7V86_08345 [bacterium D16-51]|nr:hypothetical protein D7V96_08330 [bacterium D16-59]RKI60603.1 hypothetical protein D7V86_08345 [bacterium D16-51]